MPLDPSSCRQPCQHENELVLTCRELELERACPAVYDGTMLWADVATARTSETGGTAMGVDELSN